MRSYTVFILRDGITGFRVDNGNHSGEVNGLALLLYTAAYSLPFILCECVFCWRGSRHVGARAW